MTNEIFGDTPTHWTSTGAGQPLSLFLHCSLAHSGAWRGVLKALSGDGERLCMDLPGHGKSGDWDPARDTQTQAIEMAQGLLATREGPVDLVGHSFGATVALRLAQLMPERVRSLTLIEPVMFVAAKAHPEFAKVDAFMSGPFAAAFRAGNLTEAARLFNGLWGGGAPWEALPKQTQEGMERRIKLIPASADVTNEDVHGQVAEGTLERMHMPVLLIEGAHSPKIIGVIHDVFAARLPTHHRVVVDGAGHMAPLSHPAEVAREISAFWARCGASHAPAQ